jgi:hypothetical protein
MREHRRVGRSEALRRLETCPPDRSAVFPPQAGREVFGMAVTYVLMTTSPQPRDEPAWLRKKALAASGKLRGR